MICMNEDSLPPRLLLLCLDALPPSLLLRWCDDGSLPNLRQLLEEGSSGIVESDAGLFPGSVWPTFFTMSDVSVHGSYHLLQWDAIRQKLRPPAPDWCAVTPFWHNLGANGTPAIALDIPFSDTREQAPNVVEVIGWGMHEGVWSTSHPDGLLPELNKRHGPSAQAREGPGERPRKEVARQISGLVADVGRRASIIEDLARRCDWRLLLAAFSETHRAGHWLWVGDIDGIPQGGILQVLKAFDQALPRLRRLLRPQDHLAVFSIHGMAATNDVDRVGEAAIRYLDPASALPPMRMRDPVYLLRSLLPMRLVRLIARRLPQSAYNWTFYHLQNSRGRWSRLRSIVNPLDHLVYIHANLRDAADTAELKEAHLSWLRSQLEGITTPDGRPVIEGVFAPGQRYSGTRLHLLPDLIAVPWERPLGPDFVMADGTRRAAPRHSSRDGEHAAEGFYIRAGPGVEAGSEGETVPGERLARFLCEPAGLKLTPPA